MVNTIDFEKIFLEQARKKRRKIGITIMRPIPETVESLNKASELADLVVVGAKVNGFENIVEEDQDKASSILISLLKDKKVEGIVRGQVKDSYTLAEFFKQFGKKEIPSNRKVFIGVMKKGKYSFIVSTCSVYQGLNLEDKIYEVERIIKYMKEEYNVEPKIGAMGILRPSSKRGKYEILDNITKQCTEFYEYLKNKGYDAKEYYMEYETAVWEGCNLIVPSTGFVGNSWMKALLYLGGWRLLSAPYLDFGVAYEDGTRNEKDYYDHIVHCAAMLNKGL
jgi:predicted methyltransferase MtxX (methanogen marker protein 4)